MAKVVASRFALLKVEGEDDNKKDQAAQKSNNAQTNKKKNKKKKGGQDEELRNLAFCRPTSSGQQKSNKKKTPECRSEQDWEKWQETDKQLTTDAYEKDLQEALLQSKLEFEKSKQGNKVSHEAVVPEPQTHGKEDKKKRKHKDKPATMSLDQFNQMNAEKPKVFSEELEEVPSPVVGQTNGAETDPRFFSHLSDSVQKIIQKEKIQEEYQKHFAVESVVSAKHHKEIEMKDKEIEFLRTSVKKLEEEYKQVKKRNKQLCVILAQGEMKDKAEVLMQVDQLTQVKDELTEQVSELTADLEKERSKVHSLKSELDKIKGGKHGGK
ncbi:G kinase-anchoring protein 1-like [Ostrea edulis]|uniref:G kinase-anchoring protein 1-like n=1 Tax=Ostrea edulis TaxID=37623 RepID=UPI002094CA02|nr:G kinase-anchoring protein 1-like [Ostrea edulis]